MKKITLENIKQTTLEQLPTEVQNMIDEQFINDLFKHFGYIPEFAEVFTKEMISSKGMIYTAEYPKITPLLFPTAGQHDEIHRQDFKLYKKGINFTITSAIDFFDNGYPLYTVEKIEATKSAYAFYFIQLVDDMEDYCKLIIVEF